MKKRIALLVLVVIFAFFAFAGCAQSSDSPDASAAENSSAESTEGGDDNIKIGYACMSMANTYHATAAEYFERECQERGIDYMILDDEQDGTKAVENCQLICDSGCDAYVSVMGYMVGDTLAEICEEAGVMAIGMDQPIPGFPFFGANNVEAGNYVGEALADAAIEKWGEDVEIDLYISLESLAGAQINQERMQDGLLGGLRSKLDIPDDIYVQCDVNNNDAQIAMRWVEDTINANPEAEHILIGGFVDDFGQGAEAVVEKLGYQDKVLIGTVDGSILAINNFQNPDTAWVCSVAMTPEMYGYYLLEELEPYLRGEQDSLPDAWYVKHAPITIDNYKEVLEELVIYDDYEVVASTETE